MKTKQKSSKFPFETIFFQVFYKTYLEMYSCDAKKKKILFPNT